MYCVARTDENSNYPHFDLKRAHILVQNRGVQGERGVKKIVGITHCFFDEEGLLSVRGSA